MKKLMRNMDIRYFPFLIPALLIYIIFLLYPIVSSFYYSLTDWNGIDPVIRFIGFKNFRSIIHDEQLIAALSNTFILVVVGLVISNGIALAMALALYSKKIFGRNILRTLFFIPIVMSSVVIAFVWSYLYNYNDGAINLLLEQIGLGALIYDWIGSFTTAIYAVAVVGIWQGFATLMIIYIAGLQAIPPEVVEAGSIDGAVGWNRYRHIIFPLLAPVFTINIVLTTIGSLKSFDTVFIMTQGGPGYATEVIATKIYYEAFRASNLGYGVSIGLILFFLILAVTAFQVKLLRRMEVEY